MMTDAMPDYLAPLVLTGAVAVTATLLFAWKQTLERSGLQAEQRRRAFSIGAVLLLGWFLAALVLSWFGFFRGSSARVPMVQYAILVPILAGVLLFNWWPLFRRAVESMPQQWMVGVQVYRVLGAIFLILYTGGWIPGAFALPAGIGDVITGLFAPFLASSYMRGPRGSANRLRVWNLFGILDLVVAVTTGFLTSPSPLQALAFDRPNNLITAFPLVLVPGFLVPLAVLLHLASLHQLNQKKVNTVFEAVQPTGASLYRGR